MTLVSFYVRAGVKTGYGHIVRCIALADELTRRGCACVFYTDDDGAKRARETGYSAFHLSWTFLDKSDIWIVDLEGGTPPETARELRKLCKVLVILNGVGYPNGDPGRLYADLVFYQGVTDRPNKLDWTGFNGAWFAERQWLILRDEFREHRAAPGSHDPPRVVIAAGGSDPKNVTGMVLAALHRTRYELGAIIGPANRRHYNKTTHLWFAQNPQNVAEMLAWADVAVVSFGMTAFECLALGLPVVAISMTQDHADSAELVSGFGALVSLGVSKNVTGQMIRDAVAKMLADAKGLSMVATRYIDGRGAQRVADRILEKLEVKDGMAGRD